MTLEDSQAYFGIAKTRCVPAVLHQQQPIPPPLGVSPIEQLVRTEPCPTVTYEPMLRSEGKPLSTAGVSTVVRIALSRIFVTRPMRTLFLSPRTTAPYHTDERS